MSSIQPRGSRVASIDILRGIVMIIMALDHTRDLIYNAAGTTVSSATNDPLNLASTTPVLFFTRWVTHFCAPVFIFLSGVSAWFMSSKKTKKELSYFLIKRGVWLLIVEFLIISFGITFNPFYAVIILQVIWATGISMIILGLMIYLPVSIILLTGSIIVAGHNLLDFPAISTGLKGGLLSDLVYFSQFSYYPVDSDHGIIIIYSFLPWTGLMMLGYCFGKYFNSFTDSFKRQKALIITGTLLVLMFIIVRSLNIYGDPVPWTKQKNGFFSFLSFINVNKYPPSLDYLLLTIGPAMIFLALIERVNNRVTQFINVFGRVPFFFYVLHFYLLHFIMIIVFYASGYGSDEITQAGSPFYFKPEGFGVSLAAVYLIWIAVIIVLYPLCRRYNEYKSSRRQWWLSYL